MKFPVTIRHRSSQVKIYGPAKNFNYYRLSYALAGKRRMQTFATYPEARAVAERTARELANGSQAAALTASQSRDALAALEQLRTHFEKSGRRVSLLASVSAFCEADSKLNGKPWGEAVEGYLKTVANVTRKDISEAVADFLAVESPRTKASNGERAQLSAKYAYNRKIQLEKFANTFPNTAICELSKEHLDKFIGSLDDFSAKSRNHYRTAIRQFLQWAVRKDYLSATHRLFEADTMRPEHANTAEIHFYTPRELAGLLEAADETMLPLVAIGGLAGLRTAELLRLDWKDVWRVAGHIEVTAGKSKTRQRRLVEICPALQAWLEHYRTMAAGPIWNGNESKENRFQERFNELCESAEIDHKEKKGHVARKANGLRHAFCTYHFALHANEGLTAQQAGNSPQMVHSNYKGLSTKAEAEKYFNILPPRTAKNIIPLAATLTANQ